MTVRHRPALLPVLLLVWGGLLPSAPARADDETGYGVSVGLGAPLAPSDDLGVSIGLSAFAAGSDSGPVSILRFRGELLSLITTGPWAVMPTLTGDAGVDLGRLSLYLQGGVQIFGFAHREQYTVFATLGLLGGAGMAVQVTPSWRVGVRGTVAWLPTQTTARISGPEDGDKPVFATISALITIAYTKPPSRPGPSLDDSVPILD